MSDEVMRDLVNVGAVDLIIATTDAGAKADAARSWWVSFLAQQANARGTELADLPINPAQVATIIGLVDEGKLTTKLGQQVAVAVLDGEGEPLRSSPTGASKWCVTTRRCKRPSMRPLPPTPTSSKRSRAEGEGGRQDRR